MNKNGFTLMELLAVIVILGIITVISIPLFSNVQGSSKKNSFKYFNDLVIQAAVIYNEEYMRQIKDEDFTCVALNYKELLDLNLVKEGEYKCEGIIYGQRKGEGFDFKNDLRCSERKNPSNILSNRKNYDVSKCYNINTNVEKTIVNFNYNGGSGDESRRVVKIDSSYGTLPDAKRKYYNFLGWYTEKEGGTLVKNSTIVTEKEEHTLYAHWSERNSNIQAILYNGNEIVKSIDVNYMEYYSGLDPITREDAKFIGWYTAKDGGFKIDNKTYVRIPYNHNLYAHWLEYIISPTLTEPDKKNATRGACYNYYTLYMDYCYKCTNSNETLVDNKCYSCDTDYNYSKTDNLCYYKSYPTKIDATYSDTGFLKNTRVNNDSPTILVVTGYCSFLKEYESIEYNSGDGSYEKAVSNNFMHFHYTCTDSEATLVGDKCYKCYRGTLNTDTLTCES